MNNPELVASILKKGGKCLVVGGETKDLPRQYQEHPQIIIWDDNQQDITNKVIPSNVKIIMYNRWVSHHTARKLSLAANDLHAIKFPMLKTREMKVLLAEFLQADAKEDITEVELEKEVDKINEVNSIAFENGKEEKKDEQIMPKQTKNIAKKGEVQRFISRNLDLNIDYNVKGSKVKEAKRLFKKAKEEGIVTTEASLANSIGIVVKNLGKPITKKAVEQESNSRDDFEQLDKLIQDAIAAMKLVQEHLPKVKKETEKLRTMKDKFLKLLS